MVLNSDDHLICFTIVVAIRLTFTVSFVTSSYVRTSMDTSSRFPSYVHRPGAVHYNHSDDTVHTLAWSVRLRSRVRSKCDDESATVLARSFDLINRGRIGTLENHFLFVHPSFDEDSSHDTNFFAVKRFIEVKLTKNSDVEWFEQEVMRIRTKRTSVTIRDPFYLKQWHLHNNKNNGIDINVTGLWERNITGKGVTVCVVDDGLEWTNADLAENYSPLGSWDLNDNDNNPMPSLDAKNEHGTRCAGEIAAVRNSVCGVGVAFEANISGLKILDGKMTDSLEATAFNKNLEINDIYSCSWGPEDDGKTVDGPHYLSNLALEHGINVGRGGYGTIYVVASGNGGQNGDNCNYDGYANNIYMVTIGAVDEFGKVPFYSEHCAAMLAVTVSSGSQGNRNIVTTDWSLMDGSGCTTEHTGTSAAAPLAAAMIALALQVRPCLSWRDIQYLIVLSAVKIDNQSNSWHLNAAGLHHSSFHGFGLLTAWRLVSAARKWAPLPWLSTYTTAILKEATPLLIPLFPNVLNLTHDVSESVLRPYYLWILEYVTVRVTVQHPCRGRLEFKLQCPSGSESILATNRKNDNSSLGLDNWSFTTAHCWGEDPHGSWAFIVTDYGEIGQSIGSLIQWQLVLHGTPVTSAEFQKRRKSVLEAANGENFDDFYNETQPCPPRTSQRIDDTDFKLSDKILKVLTLTSVFLFLLAVCETLEYKFCYNEEKRCYEELMSTLDDSGHPQPHPRHHPHQSAIVDIVEMNEIQDGTSVNNIILETEHLKEEEEGYHFSEMMATEEDDDQMSESAALLT